MERPTRQLVREHERILLALDVLDRLADGAAAGALDPGRIERLLDFLVAYADRRHHAKEEQVLFPKLAERGLPSDGGPVGVMLEEHEEGRDAIADMRDALAGAARGEAEGGARFAQAAAAYSSLLREHIEKEDAVLFPMAEDLLDDDGAAEVARGFAAVDEDEVGREALARLEGALDDLVEACLEPGPARPG